MRRALLLVAAAFVLGSGLGAAAHVEPSGCPFEFVMAKGTGTDFRVEPRLWPTGERCVGTNDVVDLGPGAGESIAYIVLAAVLLVLALRRRSPATRGAIIAAVVLAMGGIGSVFFELLLVFVLTGLPILYATGVWLGLPRGHALASALALWPVVGLGWALFWFGGYGHLAVASGIVFGAVAQAVLERMLRRAGEGIRTPGLLITNQLL
jgi:hypothetical protein